MDPAAAIAGFLDDVERRTGREPLSEAKRRRLRGAPSDTVLITDDEGLAAIAVSVPYAQGDGSTHWEVETVVRSDMAFAAFESMVVKQAIPSVPRGAPASIWSSRPSLTTALTDLGLKRIRRLLHMVVPLPVTLEYRSSVIRAYRAEDIGAILDIHRAAFEGHREVASLDREGFEEIARSPWFDDAGIVVATDDGTVTGFCWTKVHPNGDGEIYRIAVDPGHHGEGFGRSLLGAGLDLLSGRSDVTRGTLWVDDANVKAVELYESVGMVTEAENLEFELIERP
ncbi:MAG TPA: GNAT family N-acetyltransferase [Acidimicrobiia bacterium]|nr:GNAT family N-acetyltransferase [Acidimicrobiia bacterium]